MSKLTTSKKATISYNVGGKNVNHIIHDIGVDTIVDGELKRAIKEAGEAVTGGSVVSLVHETTNKNSHKAVDGDFD